MGEDQSVKGGQYLTGRLGGVKVLVMENRDRQSDDDPSRITCSSSKRPIAARAAQERPQERSGGAGAADTPRTPQTPSAAHRRASYGHGQRVPDHQAPLDHDDAPEWAR